MECVPRQEIEQRIARFQVTLQNEALDGAFILQNVDLFYFSGTIQTSILFIPRVGNPVLMVQKGFQRAREESPLKEVVPLNGRGGLVDGLKAFGIHKLGEVGLEMDVVPASLYLWFAETFPGCRWVDVSPAIRKLRMLKTPYEVDQIRKAVLILHKGFTEITQVIREDMTELEVDGHLSLIARREGHMGILRMRGWNQEMTHAHVLSGENGSVVSFLNSPHGGSGNTPAMAQGAGFRKIRRDEPIGIDFGVGVNGYLADQFRTYVVGDLPEDLKKAHDCSRDILGLLAREAKPGMLCSDLYHLSLDTAEKAGYGSFFMGHQEGQVKFVGHGFGLEIDELPLIAPHFKEALQPGMVIALEPKFVFPGQGVVGLEDDFLVTSSGLERLTLTEQALFRIALTP
ncbi:MAG: Xaa-Pro peptidase family protein [Syntrophales bacterium LBB04]|nr:Xaa-Pro peptidase family protein [Syntrophales bacterium LBB04]